MGTCPVPLHFLQMWSIRPTSLYPPYHMMRPERKTPVDLHGVHLEMLLLSTEEKDSRPSWQMHPVVQRHAKPLSQVQVVEQRHSNNAGGALDSTGSAKQSKLSLILLEKRLRAREAGTGRCGVLQTSCK